MKNIAIIGSGSWGVALAIHLAKLGNNIKIWSFAEDERDLINKEKKCKFLPNVTLPDGIEATNSYEYAIKGSDFIIHVTPSKFTRDTVKQYKQYVTNQPIVICSKGFEKDSMLTLDDYKIVLKMLKSQKDKMKQEEVIRQELQEEQNKYKELLDKQRNNEQKKYEELLSLYR